MEEDYVQSLQEKLKESLESKAELQEQIDNLLVKVCEITSI